MAIKLNFPYFPTIQWDKINLPEPNNSNLLLTDQNFDPISFQESQPFLCTFHFIVFKMIFLVGAVVVVNRENVSDTKYEGRAFIF